MAKIEEGIWRWYHNISECHYHIQLTLKYRKSLLNREVEEVIVGALRGIKERYAIEISEIGFDQNHVHILCRFLPKYSGGQVIRVIKSISAKRVFKEAPEIKKELWGGEFWSDGYYVATVGERANWDIVESYVEKQGQPKTSC